jgi:hypothetical protein
MRDNQVVSVAALRRAQTNDLHAPSSPPRARPRSLRLAAGLAHHDCPGTRRRQRSARIRCRESQVEALLNAERHAPGVGPLQLLIA